jgi:hypothetical protein
MTRSKLSLFITLSACHLVTLSPNAFADAGTLRLSERHQEYQVTIFTSPTPVRAGAVDVSVLIQDAAGAPVDADVLVRAWPRGRPDEALRYPATTAAATNKLFHAAVFELPEPGEWDMAVQMDGLPERLQVQFRMDVAGPPPAWHALAPWVAWPAIAIAGFAVHQCLVRRKGRGAHQGAGRG